MEVKQLMVMYAYTCTYGPMYIRARLAQLACLLRTVNKSFPDNDWLLQIINTWITCRLNWIMEPEFSIKQRKRRRPDTDNDAFLIYQKGVDSHSCPMQTLTDQGYPLVPRAITIIKDNISLILQNGYMGVSVGHCASKKNSVYIPPKWKC